MKPKVKDKLDLTIADALANLSTIVNMEIDINEPIGIVKKHKIVIQDEDFDYRTIDWFIPENAEEIIDNVKETYQVLLDYLKEIYEKDFIDFNDYNCKKGISAIMVMAAEAVNRIDQYLELLPKQPTLVKIADSNEYKELQKFYLDSILKKFDVEPEGAEEWQNEWKDNEKALLLDIEKSGLKDFESLKKDKEYDLFYLTDSSERPFFDRDLLRNIKLFNDYDEKRKDITEDPLLKIRVFLDKDLNVSARQILDESQEIISNYYKIKVHQRDDELIKNINKAIYALMLTANPKNLITNTFQKSSLDYFFDFQFFLRQALKSEEYKKMVSMQSNGVYEKIQREMVNTLCRAFFYRLGGIKQEMIGFIHLMFRKGNEKTKVKYPQNKSLWTQILENDDNIRATLNEHPNGPLMKLLDVVRMDHPEGFDPLFQYNIPSKVFEIQFMKDKKIDVLRMPCPTRQLIISKANIVDEFISFLRSIRKNQKLLIINLQDRNSYKEYPRCKALEDIQKRADFKNELSVFGINKDSDFYHQVGIYLNYNKADEFLKEFKDHLLAEESGFYLPDFKGFSNFIDTALSMVHKVFFTNKNTMSRKNRLDFIEIFYQFLILKIIEIQQPSILSFSCKDAVDNSAMQTAGFYSFIRIIKEQGWDSKSNEFLNWLIYSQALLVRDRSIDQQRLNRMISALNILDIEMLAHGARIKKAISSIYDLSFLKNLKIID